MAVPLVEDLAYQDEILQGVSRTFALTIPQLPEGLCKVVSNAYLLCRIADTVEDNSTLSWRQKRHFSTQFIAIVEGTESVQGFVEALYPLLSDNTLAAERDLVKNATRVLRITHSFSEKQRKALARCIRIMANGMAYYQERETLDGLQDLPAMDDYCYHVAGVVGEMLTELFCDYCEEIEKRREEMMRLAVSFGQGLQMTNILKDIWEDRKRGACWLPRDIFQRAGLDLKDLAPDATNPGFAAGLAELIGIARAHLQNALAYTSCVPRNESGIRRFCLWALGMAVLTLRKINAHRNFSGGHEVKITRRSVRATVILSNITVNSDRILKFLFYLLTKDLPSSSNHEKLTLLQYNSGSRT